MFNYIVDDLDGLLESLRAAGAEVDPKQEDTDYGRFAWVTDPEGNRVELWEPPAAQPPAA
jgi:predicted enzyme related to lactoylglutathione lyase